MSAVPQIPITHSILRADALADVVSRTYDLKGPLHAELLARGVNDVYLLRGGDTRYAMRVLRRGFRSAEEVRYETALIGFYAGQGIDVSAPLITRDGEGFAAVQAPEGERFLSVFTWADGAPMARRATAADAARLGATVARMHLMAEDFAPPHAVDVDSPAFMARRLPALMTMVGADSEQGRLYADLIDKASQRLRALDLPRGPCHGDIHTHNVFLADDGRLIFLDWDNCGADFFAKELLHFVWRNDYLSRGADLSAAFLTGYETVRPFSDEEREQLPFFLTVRHLFILCGMAGMSGAVGRSAIGYTHEPSRFMDLIKGPARQAGLL